MIKFIPKTRYATALSDGVNICLTLPFIFNVYSKLIPISPNQYQSSPSRRSGANMWLVLHSIELPLKSYD